MLTFLRANLGCLCFVGRSDFAACVLQIEVCVASRFFKQIINLKLLCSRYENINKEKVVPSVCFYEIRLLLCLAGHVVISAGRV